jgi:hypothetical protein
MAAEVAILVNMGVIIPSTALSMQRTHGPIMHSTYVL